MQTSFKHRYVDEGSPWTQAPEYRSQERLLRTLSIALLLLIFLLLLEASPAARAQSAAPLEEPVGGPVLRLSHAQQVSEDALQLEAHLELTISGLLARATLTQRFRNDSAEWREAEYLLPLPQDAAVNKLELQIGERLVLGEIRERNEARKVYAAARKAGKRAALLEQQRPHLFTTRVANVPPGEEIAVRVEMVLPVAYHSGEFSLRFPTTVTPVYFPGRVLPEEETPGTAGDYLSLSGSGWALPTTEVADAPLLSAPQFSATGDDDAPLNPLSLQVHLRPGMALADISALYHELEIDRVDEGFDLSLLGGSVEMDRDLVLRWKPVASATPQAAVFHEQFEDENFALLMLLPPSLDSAVPAMPRELVLVIDVSGSMQGEPMRQARASVLHALDTLTAADRVNIIAFSDHHRALFRAARPASPDTLRQARRFVTALDAGGGTEMLPALERALVSASPNHGEVDGVARLRQLVFVTDGAIGNEDALLRLLESKLGDSRLFTVGIGSAPNGYFMHRAAEAGRGEAVFIARPEEVAPRLNALFRRIGQPLTRDIRVSWPSEAEAYPDVVPDLYSGQALLQVARLEEPQPEQTIRVEGKLAGRAWERQINLPDGAQDAGVATHWAREKLASILREGRRGMEKDQLKALALPLALRFSLASPFTSFVAVEEKPVRPAEAKLDPAKLPNTRPQGQAPQQFAFAQGATSGPVKLYLGLFFTFITLIAHALNRSEP